MAIDKLVDSAQLESDLTSVADAIRAKTGGTSDLQFPTDFVSEIGSISGGGYSIDDLANKTEPSGDIEITGTIHNQFKLNYCDGLTNVRVLSDTLIPTAFVSYCDNLETLYAPQGYCSGNSYIAQGCKNLRVIVIGRPGASRLCLAQVQRSGVTSLTTVDITHPTLTTIGSQTFYGDKKLNTIILRSVEICPLQTVDAFNDTTFKSGGTGGTIYIPKVLYDELGTVSANDYKAATNWSTVDGYGTITWAQIEGSQYENYYADGTPIPTT